MALCITTFLVVWDVRLRDQVIRLWAAIYDQQAQVFLGEMGAVVE